MSKKNDILASLFIGGLLSISILLNIFFFFFGPKNETETHPHWTYTGYTGPENWGELSPEFETCKTGLNQSPINLKESLKSDLKPIAINYQNSPLNIINNGHTIQINYSSGSTINVDNETYDLLQFHFHNPSEHRLEGNSFPLEIHLVHRNQYGKLAVLGIFIESGKHNNNLDPILTAIPNNSGPEKAFPKTVINVKNLLPPVNGFYRYFGSLTTPPCSERVRWIVFEQAIQADSQQIATLSKVLGGNNRPIQELNERFLLRSF